MGMKKGSRTKIRIALIAVICISLSGCSFIEDVYEAGQNLQAQREEQEAEETISAAEPAPSSEEEADISSSEEPADGETWAIYWYLCGSDLESECGYASMDLDEMLEVELPENVQVVVQTGGASQWYNDFVDPDYLERYLYDSDGLYFVDQQPLDSMGDADTLTDFLNFCVEEYPADHCAVVFWNHGGGTVSGSCMDELFDYDMLTLDEMQEAFEAVFSSSPEEPPFEIVGFDACLMATIDTASVFQEMAEYLVASEEMEPGNGWNYAGWLGELAEDPSMDGAQLGKAICDSYIEGCEEYGTEDDVTLSVVELGKLEPLLEAYDAFGKEALELALANPDFFASFGRGARSSENYGGNTPEDGYANMVDIYDLAENNYELMPESAEALMESVNACVTYCVNGSYRSEASGLSCYYSYSGDQEDYELYTEVAASDYFIYLYAYELEGLLPEDGMTFADEHGIEELQEIPSLETDGQQEYPVYVDEGGYAVLELEAETANLLKGIYFQLMYVDEEEDIMLLLGKDNDLYMDWDEGVFMDNFRGVWGSIDGYLCYMEIIYEGEDYNLYSVPVLLNGEEYNLRVVYDYNEEEYQILGARQGIDAEYGMADRNLIQLQPGDEITTIHYAATVSGDDDFIPVEVDTFTVTENTVFEETDMGDGTFMMLYELVDCRNESTYSEPVYFSVEGEDIYVWV